LSKGAQKHVGKVEDVIPMYEAENTLAEDQLGSFLSIAEPVTSGEVNIINQTTNWNDQIEFVLEMTSAIPLDGLEPHGIFYDSCGAVAASFMFNNDEAISLKAGLNRISLKVDHVILASGRYSIGFVVNESANASCLFWSYKQVVLSISSSPNGFGTTRLPLRVEV
ncbi:hypothetical protein N8632_02520, partial [bacterium]|nr:hypothetical protein [bacterium]